MKRIITYICMLSFAFSQANAQSIANQFCETDGIVNSTLKVNNKLYLGGSFNYVGKSTGAFAAYASNNLDSVFSPLPISGSVQTIARDNSGKIYLGGDFVYQGQQKFLMVLNPDYSVATTPVITTNGKVTKIAIDGNNLVFCGNFSAVNAQIRSGIAAFDLNSNQLSAFAPNPDGIVNDFKISGSNVWIGGAFGYIANGQRASLAQVSLSGSLQAFDMPVRGIVNAIDGVDSLLFIGGEFDSIAGVSRNNIASFNTTTGALRPWNNSLDGKVNALKVLNNEVFYGGAFYVIGTNTVRSGFASSNLLTGLVSTTDLAFDAPVEKIEITNGQLHVFGNFSSIGNTNKKYFAIVSSGGSLLSSPNANRRVNGSIMVGSRILTVGNYSSFGGKNISNLAVLDYTSGNIINWPVAIDGEIKEILLSGNQLMLAGAFQNINNQQRVGIALIDTADASVASWNAQCNGVVNNIEINGSNLYLAGDFYMVGDSLRNNLACINLNTNTVIGWNPNVNGAVENLLFHGPNLFISGNFTQVGASAKKYLASFNLSSNYTLRNWNIALDSNVSSLSALGNKVLITGMFNNAGGNSHSAAILADTSTGAIQNWNPLFTGYPSTAYTENNLIFLGGDISTQSNSGLLVMSATDAAEINFPVKLASGSIQKLAKVADKIVLSGNFTLNNMEGKSNYALINFNVDAPSLQATAVSFSAISPISARVHISKGNGSNRLVLVKALTAVDTFPTNGMTYTASELLGSGSNIGSSVVAYNGTDTTFVLGNLNGNLSYHVAVYEFNGFSSYTTYNLSAPARGNFTTLTAYTVPSTSATALSFTDVRVNTAVIKWTKGNGEKRLVLLKEGAAVNQTPSDSTQYFASLDFGNGSELGTGNFVVYNGNGDSCVVSNLGTGKTYYAAVFEYNGPDLLSRYKKTLPATGSATTLSIATKPVLPASALSTSAITSSEITLNWTNGAGSNRIVIASEGQAVSSMPIDGQLYFSDNFFNGQSSNLSANERVVYVGNGSSVTVKGLNQLTNYYFVVIEYNGGLYTSAYQTTVFPSAQAKTKSSVSAPVNPSKDIVFTDKGVDYLSLKWTKGSGEKRLVVVKNKLSAGKFPVQGNLYTANTLFGLGDSLEDGSFVVSSANEDSITVTGLAENTTYYFAIYEYNESAFGGIYQTDSFATASALTNPNVGLEKQNFQTFKIYPNPVKEGKVRVEFTKGIKANTQIELRDLRGRTLEIFTADTWTQEGQNQISINLENYPKGLYFFTIIQAGDAYTLKLNIN